MSMGKWAKRANPVWANAPDRPPGDDRHQCGGRCCKRNAPDRPPGDDRHQCGGLCCKRMSPIQIPNLGLNKREMAFPSCLTKSCSTKSCLEPSVACSNCATRFLRTECCNATCACGVLHLPTHQWLPLKQTNDRRCCKTIRMFDIRRPKGSTSNSKRNLKANIAVNITSSDCVNRVMAVFVFVPSLADVRLRWNWSKTDRGGDDNLESFGSSPFGSPNVTKTTCSSMSCATVDSRSESTSYWVSFCETRNRNHWGDRHPIAINTNFEPEGRTSSNEKQGPRPRATG